MKKYFLLLELVVCLGAYTKLEHQSCRAFEVKRHNINQVEMCISNYGQFGRDESGWQGCWWPTGSYRDYIWGGGLWFGTIDSITADTLVTVGYGYSYSVGCHEEFAPGLMDMPVNHPHAIIFMYPVNWPAPPETFPMAPQDTISHQDSWCCFNDCDSTYHVPGDTRPIGLEVYQTIYAWDVLEIEDMIFFTYEVKNVSGHNLHDCYMGVFMDCEIGSPLAPNDICAGIIERTYIIDADTIVVDNFNYTWQWEAESGWDPPYPGAMGFDLLQTPFDLEWGQDKDGDGILDQHERDSAYYWNNVPNSLWDVDNDGVPDWRDPSQWPQLEMTAFKRLTLDLEPGTDPERYTTLAGYNFLTGQYEPYDTIIPDPDDQMFLMSSGPFDLAPDSIVTIVFAALFADWRTPAGGYIYLTPDSALALVDKRAEEYYDMYWFLYAPGINEKSSLAKPHVQLAIKPNPVFGSATVSFALLQSAWVSLKLYNTVGQLIGEIMQGQRDGGTHIINLDTSGLAQGTYFLVFETPHEKTSRSLVVLR